MPTPVTRRSFLGSAAAAAMMMGAPSTAEAAFAFRFNHDEQFSDSWVPWLRNVVGVAMRMIQPHVLANYDGLHSNGYSLGAGVWERSNNAQNPFQHWRHYANLMEWQLKCLQINDFQPGIHIRWAYEPTESWWGRANVNTVAIVYDPRINDVKIEGGFDLQLNAYWATTRHPANHYDGWGGTVAHEMLHNLGHLHPSPAEVGLAAAYDDRWPINIMDRCVTHNGRYRGGYRTYQWLCGGRLPS